MSNSVKFTDSGKVSVAAARVPSARDWMELVVADTGIGISVEDQGRLFREFEQIDGSHSRRYEGTGLGLALTKKLVELMGGTIRVESEPGKGSRFIARLPTRRASASEPRPAKSARA
jgi:signal transduction histidine kinase